MGEQDTHGNCCVTDLVLFCLLPGTIALQIVNLRIFPGCHHCDTFNIENSVFLTLLLYSVRNEVNS